MQIEDATPTLRDLADATGLSVAAVSKVLNNRDGVSAANRTRVLKMAEEIGYSGKSGRVLPRRRLDSASIVTFEKYVTNDAFYSDIIAAILEQARMEKLSVDVTIVRSTDSDTIDFARQTAATGGLLLVGIDDDRTLDAVMQSGRLAVLVNGMDRRMRVSGVSPDYNFGGWLATRHLLDLGHREILHVSHIYRESLRRRLLGFRDALEEAGITFSSQRHLLDVGNPQRMTLAARDLILERLRRPSDRPTAVFAANDLVAMAVLQAADDIGLSVPRDLSVIGFDGLLIGAHATPPLTTMQIDRTMLGRASVNLLLDLSRQPDPTIRRLALGVSLIERGTTVGSPV